jgi:hypothetical protein
MKWRSLRARRLVLAPILASVVAVVAIAVVPAASESSTQSRLFAYVIPTTRGPLPACSPDGSNCGLANHVLNFVYVANGNRFDDMPGFGGTRDRLRNAFVVNSVDYAIFVNGVHEPAFDTTLTPPPDAFLPSWSGHWPSTVTCPGQPGSFQPPCNIVSNPAVLPGENTAAVYTSWFHASSEPNGAYVWRFTVHGTLNGAPVDLTASSPSILMTD